MTKLLAEISATSLLPEPSTPELSWVHHLADLAGGGSLTGATVPDAWRRFLFAPSLGQQP